jgi:pimeloyl-ACP methyl ester carboxylesterase
MSALILTHGFASSEECWAAQIAGLGDKFDVTTWKLPGHRSEEGIRAPSADLRREAIEELETLVCRTEDRPYLVGHSLGGYLSLRFAISHPAAVRGLILIATGPGFRNQEQMALWNDSMDGTFTFSGMDPQIATLIHMNDSLVMDGLSELQVPALLIVGAADRPAVQRGTKYLSERLPESSYLVVPDARHNPHKTHSASVNNAIEEFILAVESSATSHRPTVS